jgi:hypothetical protein
MSQTSEQRPLFKSPVQLHMACLAWSDIPPAEPRQSRSRRISPNGDNRGMRWGLMPLSLSGRGGSPGSQAKTAWSSHVSLKSEPQSPRQLQVPFEFQKPTHSSGQCSPKVSPSTRNNSGNLLFRKRLQGHRYAVEINSRVRIRGVYRSQPRLRSLLCRM